MKIKSIKKLKLSEKVPVFDITVGKTQNFMLGCGVFVHNSKDLADSVCGVAHILFRKEAIKALRGVPQVSKTKRTGRIARRLK